MRMQCIWMAIAAVVVTTSASEAISAERGGVLRYGRYADSLFLDPVFLEANVDVWILSNLYDTLLLPTDDGRGIQPGLAVSWQMAEDNLSLSLTLRDGIKFSDGSPITAEDVQWSLQRAAKPGNSILGFLLESVADIAVKDRKTIVINLSRPDPTIVSALTVFNTQIMSKQAFEAYPGDTDRERAQAYAERPLSSGPFVLSSWNRGASMELTRNQYYWRLGEDGEPLPYLDGIKFEVIPDDATRVLKLQAGELDGAEFIPYVRVNELQADPNINMMLFPSTRVQYVSVNARPLINGQHNPLSNEKVRQALNYATDKDFIMQVVTHGIGKALTSYMSSATPLHTGDQPLYPFDLKRARQLLTEAGYASGFSVEMLVLGGSQDEIAIATAMHQTWAQIGVNLIIQQVDNATRNDQWVNGTFQMRLAAWTDDIADPSEITSLMVYSATNDAQHTGWRNEDADLLFLASQREMDSNLRAEQYEKIQEIYNATGPFIPLYESPYAVALRSNVAGFLQLPLGNNLFVSAYIAR